MTEMCTPAPWGHQCLLALLDALAHGDDVGYARWISHHVRDHEADDWELVVVAIGAIAATSATTIAATQLAGSGLADGAAEIIMVPVVQGGDPADLALRDAVAVLGMIMNHDTPGQKGVLVAVRERGELPEVAATLASMTTRLLHTEYELHQAGQL